VVRRVAFGESTASRYPSNKASSRAYFGELYLTRPDLTRPQNRIRTPNRA